jgi:hypothetical protein
VYIEKFNIENQRQSSENKMLKKKFAFSVHFTVSVNCVFVGSVCIHAVISFCSPCTEYVDSCLLFTKLTHNMFFLMFLQVWTYKGSWSVPNEKCYGRVQECLWEVQDHENGSGQYLSTFLLWYNV